MALGIVVGVVAAVGRMSDNPVLRWTAGDLHLVLPRHARARPARVLVQHRHRVPHDRVAHPVHRRVVWKADVNDVVTPLVAAILGLGLNSGAYIAEIVRSGVDRRRTRTGRGCLRPRHASRDWRCGASCSRRRCRWRSRRSATSSSACSSTRRWPASSPSASCSASAEAIYSTNLKTLELLVVASLWYLALTTLFSILQRALERRLGRGRRTAARRTTRIRRAWAR